MSKKTNMKDMVGEALNDMAKTVKKTGKGYQQKSISQHRKTISRIQRGHKGK